MPFAGRRLSCRSCGAHDSRLHSSHDARRIGSVVVEAGEMEQAMHNIQFNLLRSRSAELTRLAPRGFDADENFTVLECDHVRGTGDIHEPAMEGAHAFVRYENDVDVGQA